MSVAVSQTDTDPIESAVRVGGVHRPFGSTSERRRILLIRPYPESVIDERFPNSLEGVREFAATATGIGELLAHFGLVAANFTPHYREPGVDSMDAIDEVVGSKSDVEGPSCPLIVWRSSTSSLAATRSCPAVS